MIKRVLSVLVCASAGALSVLGAAQDDLYKKGPDSTTQPGVPTGKVIGPTTLPAGQQFPNNTHTYWVYVPAQYDATKPAALMIFNDGHAFVGPLYNGPTVLDNLIYRREIPVSIAVFINPGRSAIQPEPYTARGQWGDQTTNRPTEYNALDAKYAGVICDELLPVIKKEYNISDKPEDRLIGGQSSGAIAAFTVAWHRPDQFGKVISTIGSFVNIRGGDAYPQMIAQNEKKPIRIYLQDGTNDNRNQNQRMDWHTQNNRMVEALTAKGYDVNYSWGVGTHDGAHGGAIFPEMLRWMWRDYPRNDIPANRNPLPATAAPAAPAAPQ